MKRLSLRVRIVAVFVTIYGTIFVLLLGWMMLHIQQDFIEEVDMNLKAMAEDIEEVITRGPQALDSLGKALHETGSYISMQEHIWLSVGDSTIYQCDHLPSTMPVNGMMERGSFMTESVGERWFRHFRKRSGPYQIQIAQDITAVEHTLQESIVLFLISIPLAILLSFAGGYYLVRRLLQPLDVIMRRAQSISSENLGERIPQPGTHDEIDRMVATLNEMIQRLEQSFAQLEQFTANASHELRTPLTILKGEIEVALQQSRNDGEYRSVLESNLEEVRRISRTVEHLFLLARIDANAITPVREPVFLKPLLEEIAKDAAILAGEHEVRIESALDDIPEAQGDTIMLVQLFINLVENGIKYNRPGGSLRLKLTAHGANAATGYPGIARVEVSDTGIGIPHEELDSIFDRFYRVDKQRARSHGGAGLGLSIAQWIVRMHKGSINVRSREGEGTTFTVDIPIE